MTALPSPTRSQSPGSLSEICTSLASASFITCICTAQNEIRGGAEILGLHCLKYPLQRKVHSKHRPPTGREKPSDHCDPPSPLFWARVVILPPNLLILSPCSTQLACPSTQSCTLANQPPSRCIRGRVIGKRASQASISFTSPVLFTVSTGHRFTCYDDTVTPYPAGLTWNGRDCLSLKRWAAQCQSRLDPPLKKAQLALEGLDGPIMPDGRQNWST
jgi:hypothetical protein